MFVTKKAIPRRTVLRGLGATIALPFLDAMVPALTATAKTAAAPTPRMAFFSVPNGMFLPNFHPKGGGGTDFLYCRKQQANQYRDDGDYYQEFNEGEGFAL